jgi:hypothetical protein
VSVEVATYLSDLQATNPPSTDPRSQGDDHIRLLKAVLQNCFPGLGKAIYFDSVASKTADFTIAATDMNKRHFVSTAAGAVTATLPVFAAGDAGWSCRFIKTTTDANPLFIAPASGTLTSGYISGLAKARRCIPGVEIKAFWSGTAWTITRAIGLPIGSMVDFNSATLPPGYEWPNGQVLSSSANYPEYNSANGGLTTLDLRGRVTAALDNLGGSAANRLTATYFGGAATTVGAVGTSNESVTLGTTNLPPYTPSGTVALGGNYPFGGATANVNTSSASDTVPNNTPKAESGLTATFTGNRRRAD